MLAPVTGTDGEVVRVIREVLAPLVRADGGRLYLVSADAETVTLHLGGRFAGCPSNTLAARRIIEPAIQTVAPKVRVTVTSGALLPQGAEAIE
jgi:Fe-S cluster biogenesis protein NfuA